MALVKRITLFLAVNALIMLTISLLLSVLGIGPYLSAKGLDMGALLAFCLVWGMGGAFISLALSRVMAKWMMGVQLVPEDTRDPELRRLLTEVHQLARAARLPAMPQVGVYESPELNAFATGPSRSRSLVAVSSGLLARMSTQEREGVLAHEVAHIANGDMVTMTLVQGVVNAFVMFLARAIAYALTMADRAQAEDKGTPATFYIVQFVLEMVFMVLGSIVVAWFSRLREFRADREGARLGGRESMIAALASLQRAQGLVDPSAPGSVRMLQVSGAGGGFLRLFSTHPPLEERIRRLRAGA